MNRQRLLIILHYITLYIVWGSTCLAIKLSVETIPPFYVIGPHARTYPDAPANSGMQMLFVGTACAAGSALLPPPASQIPPTVSARSALALVNPVIAACSPPACPWC
jgi:hypothetical protein